MERAHPEYAKPRQPQLKQDTDTFNRAHKMILLVCDYRVSDNVKQAENLMKGSRNCQFPDAKQFNKYSPTSGRGRCSCVQNSVADLLKIVVISQLCCFRIVRSYHCPSVQIF